MREQEWPERIYPIYANGPGYILSADIVQFIVEQDERGTLRVLLSNMCPGFLHVPYNRVQIESYIVPILCLMILWVCNSEVGALYGYIFFV